MYELKSKVSKQSIAVCNNLASPLRITHVPYGITQPPGRGEKPAFTASRSKKRVIYVAYYNISIVVKNIL